MTARILSLQDVTTARAHYAAGHWQPFTLYDRLCHWESERPDATALIDSTETFTYRALKRWVDGFALSLHDAGLLPGDRVAIWISSRMESVAALLACSCMGYVCVPSLHRDHTPNSVLEILERTRAAAVVTERGYGSNLNSRGFADDAARLPGVKAVYDLAPLVLDTGETAERFGGSVVPSARAPVPVGDPDRVSYLAFTSGTTGQPKGVMHSDNTLLANGRAIVGDFGFGGDTVVYTFSPMSHNMGTVSLVTALSCGGTLVLHGPLDARRALERVIATRATYIVGVPTHGIDLVAQLRSDQSLGAAKVFQLAGAPVPVRLAESLLARGVKVQNCYGMTENCSFLYTRADDPLEVVTRTCGRCCSGMKLAVFDPEDRDRALPDGTEGELAVRGSSQMLGYFDDQAMTEAAMNTDGWFMTGDLGMIDADGNVRVTGRKKELIIRGGKNIHPARVEELAMRLPAISKAAAFPVSDERLGERMCLAFICADGRQSPDAVTLLAHLSASGLPKDHLPEYLLELDAFPMTASGKILKRELAEQAARGEILPMFVR
jgi:acyl-CoA synthetase